MLCDFHLHTKWSYDSDAEPKDIIEAAIANDMQYIAITDHHDLDFDNGVFEQKDPFDYFSSIKETGERYSDKIQVSVGIELGLDASQSSRLYDFASSLPFDFIIGSVHYVKGLDPYYDNYWEGLSTHMGMEKYFDAIIESINAFNDFDVLGHLDYAIRYARAASEKQYRYKEYGSRLDAILKKVISMGKGIELNTTGLRTALGTANPNEEILAKYYEYGGRIITLGSDAHAAKHVGADFSKAKNILLNCGFKEYCIFVGRKPVFLPL